MSHRFLASLLSLAALIALAVLAGGASPAQGASFTVNATHDAVDTMPGDGACGDAGGACTLRAAVMETNALPGADEISLPAGRFLLTIPPPGPFDDGPYLAAEGDLDVRGDLVLTGAGADLTVIDAGGIDRAFIIRPPTLFEAVSAEIRNVTIENGSKQGVGGAVFTNGSLRVFRSVLIRNTGVGAIAAAQDADITLVESAVVENTGGGISGHRVPLTITGSTLSRNDGGGLYSSGTVTIRDSAITNNSRGCCGYGGGAEFTAAAVDIANSTISGNSAGCFGGGVAAFSANDGALPTRLSLTNVTITANRSVCSGQGGNLYIQDTSTATLLNTIVSNGGIGGDCSRPLTSLGHNLDSDGTCGLTGPGDLSNVDPLLEPLAGNGGPTQTHALQEAHECPCGVNLAGSPALDAGDGAACPATDQRGVARPFDGDGDGTAVCDIGAHENDHGPVVCACAPALTPSPTPTLPINLPPTGGDTDPSNTIPIALAALAPPIVALAFVFARRVFTHR